MEIAKPLQRFCKSFLFSYKEITNPLEQAANTTTTIFYAFAKPLQRLIIQNIFQTQQFGWKH